MKLAFHLGLGVVWEDVRRNIKWMVGHGRDVDFWYDAWVGELGPLIDHVPSHMDGQIHKAAIADTVDAMRE
ncbi:hypothetical protein V6N13_043158 [Hibiscus sabdariffa]